MALEKLKKVYALLFFGLIAFVCNGQNPIDGEWFLQEIQIPSNEEFDDGIIYGQYDHIVLRPKRPPVTQEDIDAFMKAFEDSYEEAVASLEEPNDNEEPNKSVADSVSMEDLFHDLYIYSGIEYEVFHDTVLVWSIPNGYPGAMFGNEVYVIKELTQDRLVLATDMTLHGYMMYVYGREKQPIKRTKHNIPNDFYPNPIVQRLGQKELETNGTPAAVAYNFVNAILNSDSERMLSYMDSEVAGEFEEIRQMNGYANYDPLFSESDSKLNILGWKPYLSNNCEEAVLYVQSEWFDEFGREIKKVYVGCVPSDEVGRSGFQDITRYDDTNVKVLVVNEDDGWKVIGFK